jgi:hypothetical protein
MREAGLRTQDEIVGLSDGATWIKHLYENLVLHQTSSDGYFTFLIVFLSRLCSTKAASRQTLANRQYFFGQLLGVEHIIDVYHSSSYLDTVMETLGWDEHDRRQTRHAWLKGDIKAHDWLQKHLPDPSLWNSWNEPTQTAWRYLEERQTYMDYPSYKTRGLPIGSGQVEGVNKSVIGVRMKQSGMQWSRSGAGRMASLRARRCSKHPLLPHDTIRHHAFSCPTA